MSVLCFIVRDSVRPYFLISVTDCQISAQIETKRGQGYSFRKKSRKERTYISYTSSVHSKYHLVYTLLVVLLVTLLETLLVTLLETLIVILLETLLVTLLETLLVTLLETHND